MVLVHGSGPQDRDETIGPNKVFKDLAWGLATNGIAVLRYEKRTKAHGPKFAQLKSFTLKEEVTDDAWLAVQCLRSQPDIDAERVFVLGHSLGGTLAPRIAEQDGKLGGIILMAAAVRPLEELIIEQFEYLAKLDGSVSDEERQQIDKMAKAVSRVTDPQLSTDVPADELPFGIAASYWLDLRDYRPDEVARRLTLPMLILQGNRDYQVTPRDFELWKKSLAENKKVTFRDFPSLNHLFGKGVGPSTPAEYERRTPVDPEVIDAIIQWINSLKR
ncbi:MAG: alpha/beta fold hydrolase [Planctomycetota bacterium]